MPLQASRQQVITKLAMAHLVLGHQMQDVLQDRFDSFARVFEKRVTRQTFQQRTDFAMPLTECFFRLAQGLLGTFAVDRQRNLFPNVCQNLLLLFAIRPLVFVVLDGD